MNQEQEIARQLASAFDQSKILADTFTKTMEKHSSPIAAVAFALSVIDDIMERAYPNIWKDSQRLVGATFDYMKEMGAFVPPNQFQ